jgi:hypothetical protein
MLAADDGESPVRASEVKVFGEPRNRAGRDGQAADERPPYLNGVQVGD